MSKKEELYKNFPFAELKSSDGSARIRIYTYRYEFPDADNKDDADWHMNYISLQINGVSAEINCPIIEGRALEYLLKEISEFKSLKIKEVDFLFTEPEFCFTILNKSIIKKEIYSDICKIGTKGNVTVIHKSYLGESILYSGPATDCKYKRKWFFGRYYYLYAE